MKKEHPEHIRCPHCGGRVQSTMKSYLELDDHIGWHHTGTGKEFDLYCERDCFHISHIDSVLPGGEELRRLLMEAIQKGGRK